MQLWFSVKPVLCCEMGWMFGVHADNGVARIDSATLCLVLEYFCVNKRMNAFFTFVFESVLAL